MNDPWFRAVDLLHNAARAAAAGCPTLAARYRRAAKKELAKLDQTDRIAAERTAGINYRHELERRHAA